MNKKQQSDIWDNPEFKVLFDRRANAFNNLSDRLEELKLPDKAYEELLCGVRKLEDATTAFITFCDYWYVQPILIKPVEVIPVLGTVNIDAIYQNESCAV